MKVLFREISSDSSQWKIVLDSGPNNLPIWSRYIRILKFKLIWNREEQRVIPVEFRALFPILEKLPGLRTIATDDFIDNPNGIEELAQRVPWLQKFAWAGRIYIDRESEIQYANSPQLGVGVFN